MSDIISGATVGGFSLFAITTVLTLVIWVVFRNSIAAIVYFNVCVLVFLVANIFFNFYDKTNPPTANIDDKSEEEK